MREKINQALKAAMKAGDKAKVSTLRLITSAIKDRDLGIKGDVPTAPIGDVEITEVLAKMVKQRQESIAIFEQNARQDLADKEKAELAVIQSFLPQQLDDDAVADAIAAAIAETGAASPKDMGKVMAKLKADHAGRMDFAKASGLVKTKLSG
ncbi:MAG: GatB/YqeY domain-containing protein [Hyphomicrobiaceae bacterium]